MPFTTWEMRFAKTVLLVWTSMEWEAGHGRPIMTRKATYTAAALLLCMPVAGRWSLARETDANANPGRHLRPQSTIGDLLCHPAFAGFGD